MQLRVARQQLLAAEKRLARAQRGLDGYQKAIVTTLGADGGDAGGRLDADLNSSDMNSDDDDSVFGLAGGQATFRQPVVYRHAAKSKPLGKISSWKGAGGERDGRRSAGGSDSDDDRWVRLRVTVWYTEEEGGLLTELHGGG